MASFTEFIIPTESECERYRAIMYRITTGTEITPEGLFAIGFVERKGEWGSGYYDLKNEQWDGQIFKGKTIVDNDEDSWKFAEWSYVFNLNFYFIEQLIEFLNTKPE